MTEHPNTKQMQAIVAELRALDLTRDHPEQWQIMIVEYLYGPGLLQEAYHVIYTNGLSSVVVRDPRSGMLERVGTWAYSAPDFADTDEMM
jgi:hypothetical protein